MLSCAVCWEEFEATALYCYITEDHDSDTCNHSLCLPCMTGQGIEDYRCPVCRACVVGVLDSNGDTVAVAIQSKREHERIDREREFERTAAEVAAGLHDFESESDDDIFFGRQLSYASQPRLAAVCSVDSNGVGSSYFVNRNRHVREVLRLTLDKLLDCVEARGNRQVLVRFHVTDVGSTMTRANSYACRSRHALEVAGLSVFHLASQLGSDPNSVLAVRLAVQSV
jgi:hypothetical protein